MNNNAGSKPALEVANSLPESFVPNLCQSNALFFLLLSTQLFALVVALISSTHGLLNWEFLGLFSIYCHCIVLSCSAIICQSQSLLTARSPKYLSIFCLLTICIVAAAVATLCEFLIPQAKGAHTEHFIFRSVLVSAIVGGVLLRYVYLQNEWKVQKQAELRAKLEALQARIRPHFLFNSMNTIASLIAIDPDQAESAILDLSELFRSTLNNQKMLISAEEELTLCKRYLNIEGLRLGKRLRLRWDVEQSILPIKIPPLTLQPLLENAIYHGIQPLTEGGEISIHAYCKAEVAYILISNPLPKSPHEHHGNQIALKNIQQRLAAIFGSAAIIKTSHLDDQFTVTLRLPVEIAK